jgi:hypothetical protein
MNRRLIPLLSVYLLAACGGGGGGGEGGDSGWLSLPDEVRATLYEGEGIRLRMTGSANELPETHVEIGVLLDGSLFVAESVRREYDETKLALTVTADVRSSLSVGTHRGTIEVRACEDDVSVCAQHYGGSPWRIPVTIVVLADPGNPTTPTNGAFSVNTAGWEEYEDQASGAAMSLSATDGELHVSIGNGGTEFYHLQVSYRGVNVEAGKTYRLSFDARAAAARTIWASVHDGGRDLNGDGNIYFTYIPSVPFMALTTSMQTFSYVFTMPHTNRSATVDFFVGDSNTDVFIDNVSVTEVFPE